ncbi:hypothetical protein AMTRI_Chr12g235580 [Amborella trichopoda]
MLMIWGFFGLLFLFIYLFLLLISPLMDICTSLKNNHLLIILKYRKVIIFSDLVFFFSLLISHCLCFPILGDFLMFVFFFLFVLFICYGVINVLTHFFIC